MPGLSFLQPLLLWASLAATLPIVLHLLRRQRFRDLPFSGLIFLSSDLRRQLRASRLTHLLLLALRVLLVLLLCIAVAGPRVGGLGFSGRATSLAIVVDQSASMGVRAGGQTALEKARQAALRQMKSLRATDRVSLIGASLRSQTFAVEKADGAENAEELVRRLEPTFLAGDLAAGIQEALSILENSELSRRRLVVITDGQEAVEAAPELEKRGIELETIDVSVDAASNLYIADLRLPRLRGGGVERRVSARVGNAGTARARGTVRLNLDGAFLGERPLDLRPGAVEEVRFDVPIGPGPQFGFVELTGDDLEADNRRFFGLGLDAKLAVGIVGSHESRRYVELALGVEEDSGNTGFEILPYDLLGSVGAGSALAPRVLVVCDLNGVDRPGLEAMASLRGSGAGVLLFLGSGTIPSMINEIGVGSEVFPARLTGKESGEWSGRVVQPRHRLLPAGAALDGLLGTISFRERHRVVVLGKGGLNLLEYSDGEPLLTELRGQSPPMLVATTAADRAFSDLSLSPYFVLLLRRAVEYLGGLDDPGGLPPGSSVPELTEGHGRWEWIDDPGDLLPKPVPNGSLDRPGALVHRSSEGHVDQWKEVSVDPAESRLGRPQAGSARASRAREAGLEDEPRSVAFPAAILALMVFLAEGLLTIRLSRREAIG